MLMTRLGMAFCPWWRGMYYGEKLLRPADTARARLTSVALAPARGGPGLNIAALAKSCAPKSSLKITSN